jgi:hypothetical protein
LCLYYIKDLSKLNFRSGQSFVFEGIKAGIIEVKSSKEINSSIRLKINETLDKLKITGSYSLNNGIKFSGKNLFLAQKVIEIGKTKTVKTKEKSFPQIGITEYTPIEMPILDYTISIDYSDYLKFIKLNSIEETQGKYLLNLEILNLKSQNFNGEPLHKFYTIMNNSKTQFYISERKNSEIVSDYFTIFFNIYQTQFANFFQIEKGKDKVIIKRNITPFKIVKQ